MKAKKDNKIYRIVETQKKRYLADGYDIYDDEGNLIEYSPLKKIEYNKYIELKKENEGLKEKITDLETQISELQEMSILPKEKSLSKMDKGELIAKAIELGLEVNEEMKKTDIVSLIEEAQG